MTPIVCAPAFGIDDRYDTVKLFCDQLASKIWSLPSGQSWILDLSSCEYLGPDAAAIVYATWLSARSSGVQATVRLPNQPKALDAFCSFSGLRHHLEGGRRPQQEHGSCETAPLNQFYQAVGNQADPLLRLVRRHMSSVTIDAELYLASSFSEVVQNIEDHARSPIGGVSCARYFSGTNQVRVAIVDAGLGIGQTLRQFCGPLTDVEALSRVLRGGTSSRSTQRNMGLGISNLASMVANTGGELLIFSNRGVAKVDAASRDGECRELGFGFPGTGIFFKMNLDEKAWS